MTPLRATARTLLLLAAAAIAAGFAPPPPAGSPSQPPAPAEPPAQPAPADPFANLPPQVRLGLRVAHTQRILPVLSTVVIVPDADSYVAAIGRWSIHARYPVLIDDGTWIAQQDIARFVRAFRPRNVVRWSAPAGETLPEDPPGRRAAIERAAAAAWGAPDAASLRARWDEVSLTPPGLIATNEGDGAWTAALALAAGRGQVLVWVPRSHDHIGWQASLAAVDALSRRLEEAAAETGLSWDGLGDDLDAITLCLDFPVKVDLGESSRARMWATTDVLGRDRSGERTRRWAWAGQIAGSEARAAYMAMCALFLRPPSAWLFDGYENTEPWSHWDATAAAIELERAGVPTVVGDDGAQGADDFRLCAAGRARVPTPREQATDGSTRGGARFGLIAVNTSGNAEFFDLRPGRALAGDVPFLAIPSIVHFVHSWSANRPNDRNTIAGRFLERGVYGYVGSVHEPYLQAFTPTPLFVKRLLAHAPLGVAPRLDSGPPWKIAILGDPLFTLGPAPDEPPEEHRRLPLEGAKPLADSLAEALQARDFHRAVIDLSLMARDEDVVRLVRAIQKDKEARLDPDTALAAASSLYLSGAFELFTDVYDLAIHGAPPDADVARLALRDMLWHTLWPIRATLRPHELTLLRLNIRKDPYHMPRDAAEVHGAIGLADGHEAARDFLERIRSELPSDEARRQFNEYLRR